MITLSGIVAHLCAKWRIWRSQRLLARWNKPMESENQIIVQCKQPIKMDKPLQCLLSFRIEWNNEKILHKTGNAQSRAKHFRHSAVLSFPAVLLRKATATATATATRTPEDNDLIGWMRNELKLNTFQVWCTRCYISRNLSPWTTTNGLPKWTTWMDG